MGDIGDRFISPDDPTLECTVVWSGGPLLPASVSRKPGSSLGLAPRDQRLPRTVEPGSRGSFGHVSPIGRPAA